MNFVWQQEPEDTVWIWVRVEERSDPLVTGPILASAGPVAYTPGEPLSIELSEVSNGSHRHVIADVRESANPNLAVLYYGISDAFELRPDRHTVVDVSLELRVPEAQAVTAEVGLLFAGETLSQVGLVQVKAADIHFRSAHADGIVLANDASFKANLTELPLTTEGPLTCTEEAPDADGNVWLDCLYSGWDLLAGVGDEVEDREFTVFARFVDRFGYESKVYRASVVLDSQGPAVILTTLTPAIARPGADVYLSLTFAENVQEESLALTVAPDLPPGSSLSDAQRIGTSTSYLWTLHLAPEWTSDDDSFAFAIARTDLLNNSEAGPVVDQDGEPLLLVIDAASPTLASDALVLSQALFGLPDVEAGSILSFDFAIAEDFPHQISAGQGGLCQGICPEVRLGPKPLGKVYLLEATEEAPLPLSFRYEYLVNDLDFAKKDSEPELSIVWSDLAGNALEHVVQAQLRFDFQPPTSLSCSLVPGFGNQFSEFIYTLTASETLPEAPTLNTTSLTPVFAAPPTMSDGGQTWEWRQKAAGLESQEFTVSANLLDGAGNASPAPVCELPGAVDGKKPELLDTPELPITLWTTPEVQSGPGKKTLALGNDYQLHVRFSATDASGIAEGYPVVKLAVPGKEIALVLDSAEEAGADAWTYEFSAAVSAQDNPGTEGLWPVRVTLQDTAANEEVIDSLGDQLVKIDFTPPAAECSLIPAPEAAGYPIGQKVRLQIVALEELPPTFVPVLSEQFAPLLPTQDPFFAFEAGTHYQFFRSVQDGDGEHTFSVGVSLTDLVGNSTPAGDSACNNNTLIGGKIDGTAPVVHAVDIQVDDGTVDFVTTPLKAGRTVTATIEVSGTSLAPTASIGNGAMGLVSQEPQDLGGGHLLWTLTRTLVPEDGQGIQTVHGVVVDEAGNATPYSASDALTLDFSPPAAQCKVFPTHAKVGDTLTVTVNASEPLLGGLPEFIALPEALLFEAPEADENATGFEYKHFVSEDDAAHTAWTFEVTLTDLAGNATQGVVCTGGGAIDAMPPTVDELSVAITTAPAVVTAGGETILAVGPGYKAIVEFTILDAQGVPENGTDVVVDIPGAPVALEQVAFTSAPGSATVRFERIFEPDDFIIPEAVEGLWPIKVQTEDLAGNMTVVEGVTGKLLRVDFSPPKADCSLIPTATKTPYAIGTKILAQAAPLEPLSTNPDDAPQLAEAWTEPFDDAEFLFFAAEEPLRFAGTISNGTGERQFEVNFSLTDLVGNHTPAGEGACIGGPLKGAIDGTRPTLESISVVVDDGAVDPASPLKAGRTVTAQVTLTNTSQMPAVSLGASPLSSDWEAAVDLGDDRFQWQFSRTLDGFEGDGLKWVRVSGQDSSGNSFDEQDDGWPLTLDFTPPTAVCTVAPALAKLGDTILLDIATDEPLQGGLPSLAVLDDIITFIPPPADDSATQFGFTHQVGLADAPVTSWSGTVTLVDIAGNASDGTVCLPEGQIDAIPPTLQGAAMATEPPLVNQAGQTVLTVADGGTLLVSFKAAEAQAIADGFPQVYLNVPGNSLPFVQETATDHGDGTVDYTFSLSVSAQQHQAAEGKWPVRVVVEDLAGNYVDEPKLAEGKRLELDFTAPTAVCMVDPEYAGLGTTVTVSIDPSEELSDDGLNFSGTLSFGEPAGNGYPAPYTLSAVVGNGDTGKSSWSYEAVLTDLAGNTTAGPVCSGSGQLDAIPPEFSVASSLETTPEITNNAGDVVLMVGHEGTIVANFAVLDAQGIAAGYPKVTLAATGQDKPFDDVELLGTQDGTSTYRATLQVDSTKDQKLEGLWPVRVEVMDLAGNQTALPAVGDTAVNIDFTPPTADCAFIPAPPDTGYAIGHKVMLQVTPVEELIETPTLIQEFTPMWDGPFLVYEDETNYRFGHTLLDDEGERTVTLSVAMEDLVGNQTKAGETSCLKGVMAATFDAVRPTVVSVEIATLVPGIDPTEVPLSKGQTVIATVITTNSALEPLFTLGARSWDVAGSDDLIDGDTAWYLSITLDGTEGHGQQTLVATGADAAGNTFVHEESGQPLTLDFQPPEVQCSLFPKTAKLNDTVIFTVNVSELLLDDAPTFNGTMPVGAPSKDNPKKTFTYSVKIDDVALGETTWTFGITACDVAGNCTAGPASCSGEVKVDALMPAITNGLVVTSPVVTNAGDEVVKVVRDDGTITASFRVAEGMGVAPGFPTVFLNAGGTLLPFTETSFEFNINANAYDGVFELTADEVTHAGLEGLWPVRVVVQDLAGNVAVADMLGGADHRIRLDFTPPEAECALIPAPGDAPYGIGDSVVLQVSPLEAASLSVAPILKETFAPDPPGSFFTYEAGTTYRWSGTVAQWNTEGTFGATVRLADLVGNQTPAGEDVCKGKIAGAGFDGKRPVVSAVSYVVDDGAVAADTPLRAGRKVTATFTVTGSSLLPVVTLGAGALEKLTGPIGNGPYTWTFQRTLDGTEGDNAQKFKVTVLDPAGNSSTKTEEANVPSLDFTNPLADCFVNVEPAKSGDSLRLTVSMSEPILSDQPALTSSVAGFWAYQESLSFTDGAKPYYVFEHPVVPGDGNVAWLAQVQAQDKAGNPNPAIDLCTISGNVDASGITLSDEDVTVTFAALDTGVYARIGSVATITFTTSDEPANKPVVRVGDKTAAYVSGPGTNNTYVYTFKVAAEHEFTSGQKAPVTVYAVDSAGNETYKTIWTLTLDFDAPSLATTPYFVRCDNLATARVDDDEIWLTTAATMGCTYSSGGASGPAQVSFALSENIDLDTLTVFFDNAVLTLDANNSSESFITALYDPAGTESQKTCRTVKATVVDLAANSTTLDLGCFWFDFAKPAQPDVATAGRIVYMRAPWGTDATGGAKKFTVTGTSGAVEGGATVKFWDGETIASAGLAGTVTAAANGSFATTTLNPIDRSHLFMTVHDAAGNASDSEAGTSGTQGTLIRNIEWYGTFGSKTAGSFVNNPHTFETTRWFRGGQNLSTRSLLEQNDTDEYGKTAGIDLTSNGQLTTKGALVSWRRMVPNDGLPPQRRHHKIAYDSRRGRAVLFGGIGFGNVPLSDTWEWDGDTWHYVIPEDPEGDGNPEARWGQGFAYQAHTGTILLWGGRKSTSTSHTSYLYDTWEWNGTSWKKLSPISYPGKRDNPAMAYDAARSEVVLHGGYGPGVSYNDTWTFDGSQWTKESPSIVPPYTRGHPMVFDSTRDLTVMYNSNNGTIYEWNGSDWKQNAASGPAIRAYPTAVYHPGLNVTILVGGDGAGSANCSGMLKDVWYWNGTSWSEVQTVENTDESFVKPHRAAAAVFDPARGEAWLMGGEACTANTAGIHPYSYAWWPGYSGSKGIFKHIGADIHDGSPPGRYGAAFEYSPLARQGILFGGKTFSGAKNDTWLWYTPQYDENTNTDWLPAARSLPASAIATRNFTGFNPDAVHDLMIVFGGWDESSSRNDTFGMWTEAKGSSWTPAPLYTCSPWVCYPVYTTPPARYGAGMVYDDARDFFLLFGGSPNSTTAYNDTWVLEEVNAASFTWGWRTLTNPSGYSPPSARTLMALAFDRTENRSVLFGGISKADADTGVLYADTYEHTGTRWEPVATSDPHGDGDPAARWGAGFTNSDQTNSSFLCGGRGNSTTFGDLWEYSEDYNSWRYLPAADPEGDGDPIPRWMVNLIYDEEHRQLVMTAGATDTWSGLADTWVGRTDTAARPAHLAHFRFKASGYCSSPSISNVAASWRVGSTSYHSGATYNAAFMRAWSKGTWPDSTSTLAMATDDNPTLVTWSTSDADVIKQCLVGAEKQLSLAVFPVYGSESIRTYNAGDGLASITTDYVEAKVTYQLTANDHDLCD